MSWSGPSTSNESAEPTQLRELLEHCLFLAVIGSSRLPITSLESPLPEFTFGRLGYFPGGSDDDTLVQAKLLELSLRAPSETQFAAAFTRRRPLDVPSLFNQLALSPYTDFVPKLTNLIQQQPVDEAIAAFSYLLRHLVRHITAFDLQVFHNRGADYPMPSPSTFGCTPSASSSRITLEDRARIPLVRRALRQAWLSRKQLEGLRVPDHPTSPGENLRVLPEPFGRLPDEQVTQPDRRKLDCSRTNQRKPF